jgi:hypothetical protein
MEIIREPAKDTIMAMHFITSVDECMGQTTGLNIPLTTIFLLSFRGSGDLWLRSKRTARTNKRWGLTSDPDSIKSLSPKLINVI